MYGKILNGLKTLDKKYKKAERIIAKLQIRMNKIKAVERKMMERYKFCVELEGLSTKEEKKWGTRGQKRGEKHTEEEEAGNKFFT